MEKHELWEQGNAVIDVPDRTYEVFKALMESMEKEEGVVFHHPDGCIVKVRRKDMCKMERNARHDYLNPFSEKFKKAYNPK